MKLTRASSYALHALAYMAGQKTYDVPIASHKIAEARGIPERFLLKVLKPLVNARVLLSIKGPNGGYRLAKPADEISMLEILEATDGTIQSVVPPPPANYDGPLTPKQLEAVCGPLNKKLESSCTEVADTVKKQLSKIRLSDLVGSSKK
jgi:Rrf2 family protein